MPTPLPTGRGLVALAVPAFALVVAAAPALADARTGDAITETPVTAGAGAAADTPADTDERVSRLEEAVGVLAEEQNRLRNIIAVPEDKELVSVGGLGPYASKVYLKDRGLSIGGYGEWRGRMFVKDNEEADKSNELDALRGVLYVGYKFTDWIVFNSEFEFEHAGTGGGGSTSIEFMAVDFMLDPMLNGRIGLVLLPMGFINEVHEPIFFYGASRPEVERRIIPSTWRENGMGFYGTLFERVDYRMYAVNGFDAQGFDDSGLRGGRQKGSEAFAEHWAFVGRADITVIDGAIVGGSVYYGNSGQNQVDGGTGLDVPDTPTTIWEIHAELKRWGVSFRALWAWARLQDTRELNIALDRPIDEPVAKEMQGGYAEIAYDVMPWIWPETQMTFEPFYRFEHLNTQQDVASGFFKNPARDQRMHVVGLQFKPHPQVALKFNYRDRDFKAGKQPDEIEFGFGVAF